MDPKINIQIGNKHTNRKGKKVMFTDAGFTWRRDNKRKMKVKRKKRKGLYYPISTCME